MYIRTNDQLGGLPSSYTYDTSLTGVGIYRLGEPSPPSGPITVGRLAGSLTNLVLWARHPILENKPLKPNTPEATEWSKILRNEVTPAFRDSSAEWRVGQLIFFSRHADVLGHFNDQPKDMQ